MSKKSIKNKKSYNSLGEIESSSSEKQIRCPRCGFLVFKTDFNSYFCVNCGGIPVEEIITKKSKQKNPKYIG